MKINFWNGRRHSNEEHIHQISADGLFFSQCWGQPIPKSNFLPSFELKEAFIISSVKPSHFGSIKTESAHGIQIGLAVSDFM